MRRGKKPAEQEQVLPILYLGKKSKYIHSVDFHFLTAQSSAEGHSFEEEHGSWEFDTVRAAPSDTSRHSSESVQTSNDSEAMIDLTRKPQVNARVPTSFRVLFGEDKTGGESDSFRIPMSSRSRGNTPIPPPNFAAPVQLKNEISPPKRDINDEKETELHHHPDFVFPPRSIPSRLANRNLSVSGSPPDDDDFPSPERSRLLPLGPGHGHGRGIGEATMSTSSLANKAPPISADDSSGNNNTIKPVPAYRERRTSRGVPDISIPPADTVGSVTMVLDSPLGLSSGVNSVHTNHGSSPPKQAVRFPFGRQRSQSSTTAPSGSTPRRTNMFPNDFHFPPVAATATMAGPSLPLPVFTTTRGRTHNAMSPSHGSISSSSDHSRSPAAHQTTHSLDNSTSISNHVFSKDISGSSFASAELGQVLSVSSATQNANMPSEGQQRISPISAHPLSRKPSVTRQASVAVMETVHSTAVAVSLDTTHGKVDSHAVAPVPGLKDVLRVPSVTTDMHLGIADLLPPSPSASSAGRRFFSPTPSSLNPNIRQLEPNQSLASPNLLPVQTAPPSPSLLYQDRTQNNDLVLDIRSSTDTPTTGVSANTVTAQTAISHPTSSLTTLGPIIRPLDFDNLMSSHEFTHNELSRTVDELVQWLSIVQSGLTSILDRTVPVNGSSTIFEGSPIDELDLARTHEDETFDESKLSNSVNEDVGDLLEDEIDSSVISYEQFLASMHKERKESVESELSSGDDPDDVSAVELTVHPSKQLAAFVS